MEKARLSDYIQKLGLNPAEAEDFVAPFEVMHVQKRQFLTQPGFTASHRYFVLEGAFRAYVVCGNGHEHTISFAIEDWWISDYNSYIFQEPATMFVVALEDAKVLRIAHQDEQALKDASRCYERVFRQMAERGLAFQQRRIVSNLTRSAEERYNHFLKTYPDIVQRVPQYALASYLGMTTEFLSKIRNRKVRAKG